MAAKSAYLICNSYFSWKISSRNAGLVHHKAIIYGRFVVDGYFSAFHYLYLGRIVKWF